VSHFELEKYVFRFCISTTPTGFQYITVGSSATCVCASYRVDCDIGGRVLMNENKYFDVAETGLNKIKNLLSSNILLLLKLTEYNPSMREKILL
jgi:hypothetical protein